MDPVSSAASPAPAPPSADRLLFLTWPKSVQAALGLLLVGATFFLLGRWSNPSPPLAPEQAGPALDLNRATRAELRLLPGVGDALAQRVIDYRQRKGLFRTVEDLRQVAGFGPKTLDRLRPVLFVSHEEFDAIKDDGPKMPTTAVARPAVASKKAEHLTQPINVNSAKQAELQKLPGIGPKLSQRILDERARARFKSIDELRRVPGIGPKTLEKLRPYVTIEDVRTIASAEK